MVSVIGHIHKHHLYDNNSSSKNDVNTFRLCLVKLIKIFIFGSSKFKIKIEFIFLFLLENGNGDFVFILDQ